MLSNTHKQQQEQRRIARIRANNIMKRSTYNTFLWLVQIPQNYNKNCERNGRNNQTDKKHGLSTAV